MLDEIDERINLLLAYALNHIQFYPLKLDVGMTAFLAMRRDLSRGDLCHFHISEAAATHCLYMVAYISSLNGFLQKRGGRQYLNKE